MTSLTTQSKTFAVVVSLATLDKGDLAKAPLCLLTTFQQLGNVAIIVHDKDVNEDGTTKTPHIHMVLQMLKRHQKAFVINQCVNSLGVSPFAVSVEKALSLGASIQYLTHKNQTNKYQYPETDIVKSWDNDWLVLQSVDDRQSLDFDTLFKICSNAQSRTLIIKEIGLSYYKNYRAVINDILHDLGKE